MNDGAPPDGQTPEHYYDFLRYLARLQLDPRLQSRVDPEDIVQQTLLDAHQGWERFRGQNEFQVKAWLRQILMRVLANALRDALADKRDVTREHSLDRALEDSSARLDAFLAAEQSTPGEQALRNERALQLEEALAGLPERQRQAVVLKHMHGWSLLAIAEHLGVSASAVAGLLVRGLRQLRDVLPE